MFQQLRISVQNFLECVIEKAFDMVSCPLLGNAA